MKSGTLEEEFDQKSKYDDMEGLIDDNSDHEDIALLNNFAPKVCQVGGIDQPVGNKEDGRKGEKVYGWRQGVETIGVHWLELGLIL